MNTDSRNSRSQEVLKMNKKAEMFTASMIAPCGLDCSLCRHAHDDADPCLGCRGPEENKYTYCLEKCGIVRCERIRENRYEYCIECPDFPCEDVMEKETRYTEKYPLFESPFQNLRDIQETGMERFLEKQRLKWTCKECGGVISVHTGVCTDCGKAASPADFMM